MGEKGAKMRESGTITEKDVEKEVWSRLSMVISGSLFSLQKVSGREVHRHLLLAG